MDLLPEASLARYSPQTQRGFTVAFTVEVARTFFQKIIGRMFTREIAEEYVLLFPFSNSRQATFHMMGVPYDLGIVWIKNNRVQKQEVMDAWVGQSSGEGDIVLEMHPETAKEFSEGDIVYLQGEHSISQLEKPDSVPDGVWYDDDW